MNGRSSSAYALAVIVLACGQSPERERVDFERMRVQQRYGLYGASRSFANGQSMQEAPSATVSREAAADLPLLSGASTASDIPVPSTPELLARGKDRFTIYCAVCHGDGGFGGSIVAWNMGRPRPPSLRTNSVRSRGAGYLFDVATHGKGRMPSYAAQLSATDRWAIVAYVRDLQRSRALNADERADSLRALEIRVADSVAMARDGK